MVCDDYILCNQSNLYSITGNIIEVDDIKGCETALVYFILFFTTEIASIIAEESNTYFESKLKENIAVTSKIINLVKIHLDIYI